MSRPVPQSATERVRKWRAGRRVARTCQGCGESFTLRDELSGRKFCSALCRSIPPPSKVDYANCVICGKLFVRRGKHKATCNTECSNAFRKTRNRARYYMRRIDETDITPAEELAMRQRTRKCRLCGVYMTSRHNKPNSKHLDHILPRNQGGTHTHGNVRIICALCNLRRPKDGSDFAGQLTLWAQGPVPVSRPDRRRQPNRLRETCRSGLHPWTPDNIFTSTEGKKRCLACMEARRVKVNRPRQQCKCGALFAARGNQFMCDGCIEAAGHRAAELHATGMSWIQVAEVIGYGSHNGEGARFAAKRIGYTPAPRQAVPVLKPRRACADCGRPKPEGKQSCPRCHTERAWRPVELRQEHGWTLRMIANELGFTSITTVTNLIQSVDMSVGPQRRESRVAS